MLIIQETASRVYKKIVFYCNIKSNTLSEDVIGKYQKIDIIMLSVTIIIATCRRDHYKI